MTQLKSVPSRFNTTSSDELGWAPRLAQEVRLTQLDHLFAAGDPKNEAVDIAIERAALLGALNRHQEARQSFIDILRRAPANFSALNEFGTLLLNMGAIAAARRVYEEAIIHHPSEVMARVNLANLLLRANDHIAAREHYEAVLRIDAEHPQAHQGLGAVLSDMGDRVAAGRHFQKGFLGHAVSCQPYRGSKPPMAILQLVSSGGGNIPTASFLDDRTFSISVIVADYFDPSVPLPPHQLVFNTIGDADLCQPALRVADALIKRTKAPVLNYPAAVMKTGRIANAERLRNVPGLITPRTIALTRDCLAGPNAAAMIASHGLAFPLLLRSPGFHTGRNFVYVESTATLLAAVTSLPGDEFLVIEYLDARGHDSQARKYRVMMIDGELYPLHLAISPLWKVHYFTADMAERPDHRAEEAAFLNNMPVVIGDKAVRALVEIRDTLGLDYCGVDFGLDTKGDVLLFEANATMVICPPDADERWTYRRGAVTKALDAAVTMLKRRIDIPALVVDAAAQDEFADADATDAANRAA